MRILVLGPVVVRAGGADVDHGGGDLGSETLLAALLTQPRQVVSISRLVDLIWDESPPRSATALVHTYVSQPIPVRADLVARLGNGDLWLYPNTGNPNDPFHGDGHYQIGIKWNGLSALSVTDVDGDGRADMVAKDGGVLWLYPNTDDEDPFNGERRREIGVGWHGMDAIVGAQLGTDGPADLVVRDVHGGLWIYPNTGNADDPYNSNVRRHVGIKWNEMSAILVGDANVDGRADVVAKDGGVLWLYPNTDDENPFNGERRYSIGFGWNAMEDMT